MIKGEPFLCREKGSSYLPPITQFDCATKHALAPLRGLFSQPPVGAVISAPCLTLTGTAGAVSWPWRGFHTSTFLPPFPQSGFASRPFSESLRSRTMKALTPARLTHRAGLPAYLAIPSCRSVSNHVGLPGHRYRHASVPSEFRTSP